MNRVDFLSENMFLPKCAHQKISSYVPIGQLRESKDQYKIICKKSHGLVHRELICVITCAHVCIYAHYFKQMWGRFCANIKWLRYGLAHKFSCIRTDPYQVHNGRCVMSRRTHIVAVSCGYDTCFAVWACDGLCHLTKFMDRVETPFRESLVIKLHSEIDQIHLSIEAQCGTACLPLDDCHTYTLVCMNEVFLRF